MPSITFLVDRVVRDEHEGTENETAFKAGQVVEASEESAQHWINRGVAELTEDDEPKKRGRPRKKVAPKAEEITENESAD